MRIIFIKKRYHPFGGAELYLKKVVNVLKDSCEVHLLTESWGTLEGVKVHRVSTKKFFPFKDLAFALSARSYLKNLGNYFVSVSFDRTLYQKVYRASEGCHKRWLENRKKYLDPFYKAVTFELNPKHLVIKWLEKKCLKVSEVIVTNSKMVKEDFGEFYGASVYEKCRIIYNGVDLKRFCPPEEEKKQELRRDLGLPEEEPVILFLGSGYFRKGLHFLLKALSLLPDHFLLVVGKEKRLSWFKTLAGRLGIEKQVQFLGSRKEVLSLYQAADLFVLPTIYDPFSNVCLEALACGLPVITTRANGAGELIEREKNGFVLDLPPDPEDLALSIQNIYQNLSQMRRAALETAKKHSMENSVKKFLQVIKCVS